jgi:hypothetical protein
MIKFYDEILSQNKLEIYLPFSNNKENYIIPNCYYINPKGVLYNCFGNQGHKEVNMVYTYMLIKDAFYDIRYISISSDGKISLERELRIELEKYKRIITTNSITRDDVFSYLHMDCCDLDNQLLINNITGIISSKICLLEYFINIKNKYKYSLKDIMNEIVLQSNDDINDVLVRLCGFHKIETIVDKIITTSSLDLNQFLNYLDNDFNIYIIPEIVIDHKSDEYKKELIINRFIDKNPDYSNRIIKC